MFLGTFFCVFMSVCNYVTMVLVYICHWTLVHVFVCLHASSVLFGKPALFHMKHHALQLLHVFTARGVTCITHVSAARAAINQKTR